MTLEDRKIEFLAAAKGIHVRHIAFAMTEACRGVIFQGCNRDHLAEVWANANAVGQTIVYHRRLGGVPVSRIMAMARARQNKVLHWEKAA